MGGLGSGRLPNECQRRDASRMRTQGLPLAEIGRRLGVSRQRVGQILRAIDRAQSHSLNCRACGGVAAPAGIAPPDATDVLCLVCLADQPEAPFAERLRSCRAAAGLRRRELAQRAGLTVATLKTYEDGTHRPQWRHLMPLVRVLGLALVGSDADTEKGDQSGHTPPPIPEPCPA
jgi:transcriptional regulator with XRE-family HTH domain